VAVAYRKNSFVILKLIAIPVKVKELLACLMRFRIREADTTIAILPDKSLDSTVVRIVLPVTETVPTTFRMKLFILAVALVKLRVLEISLVNTTDRTVLPIVVKVPVTERNKLDNRFVAAATLIVARLNRTAFLMRSVELAIPIAEAVVLMVLISLADCPTRLVETAFVRIKTCNLTELATAEIAVLACLITWLNLVIVATKPKVAVLVRVSNRTFFGEPINETLPVLDLECVPNLLEVPAIEKAPTLERDI